MLEYSTIRLYSKELETEKRVFVYVPKSYDTSDKFYPVLYMHDGQNLFDDKLAFQNRGWRLMDLFEEYADIPEVIIVGIESDGRSRTDELIPFPFQFPKNDRLFGGKANLYLDFIVQTVKPLIDQRYRTFKNRKNTAIMGSSFGGVNSFYAALKYQSHFARFACMSGAFHYSFLEPFVELLENTALSGVKKLYMDTGTMETDDIETNERYIESNRKLASICNQKLDDVHFRYVEVEGAKHHERDWEKRFPEIMKFMFNE